MNYDEQEKLFQIEFCHILSNLKYWSLNPEENGPSISEIDICYRVCQSDLRRFTDVEAFKNTVLYKRGSQIRGNATHGCCDLKDLTHWDKVNHEVKSPPKKGKRKNF